MTIGILLITHSGVGQAFIDTLMNTFTPLPLNIKELSVDSSSYPDVDLMIEQACCLTHELDQGDGVLVLTDMIGSTPSNIAQRIITHGHHVRVITGVNLPMLFRILNYPNLSLNSLAEKARSGGQEGILEPHGHKPLLISPRSASKIRRPAKTEGSSKL